MITQGTIAPDFTLLDQDGSAHTLSQYRGRYVLIYFYPKDNTPGCTTEACVIRDLYKDFEQNNVKVLGISADTSASHKKFSDKYNLPFTLLADTKKEVIKMYDANKTPIGIKRISYLIAPDGTVAKTYPKVTPADHGAEILKDIYALA